MDRDWLGDSQFGKGWTPSPSLILLQCNALCNDSTSLCYISLFSGCSIIDDSLVGQLTNAMQCRSWKYDQMPHIQVTIPEGAKGFAVKCIAENERIGHQVATQKILSVQCKDHPVESYHDPYL